MDRYTVATFGGNPITESIIMLKADDGEWVKYSDVEALQARVRELEEQVAQIANDFEQTVEETKELFGTMIINRETIAEYVEVLMPIETWNEVQKFRGIQ